MSRRKTVLERVADLAQQIHGPRTKVVVYRDKEIDVWCVDLMSGKRWIREVSTSGTKSETLRAMLEALQSQAETKPCPTCGREG